MSEQDGKDQRLEETLSQIDARITKVEDGQASLSRRVDALEWQMGRLVSHVESELGLARSDLGRIENKLFGKEDDLYGGRIGQLFQRIHRVEITMMSLAGAASILSFALLLYQFFKP